MLIWGSGGKAVAFKIKVQSSRLDPLGQQHRAQVRSYNGDPARYWSFIRT